MSSCTQSSQSNSLQSQSQNGIVHQRIMTSMEVSRCTSITRKLRSILPNPHHFPNKYNITFPALKDVYTDFDLYDLFQRTLLSFKHHPKATYYYGTQCLEIVDPLFSPNDRDVCMEIHSYNPYLCHVQRELILIDFIIGHLKLLVDREKIHHNVLSEENLKILQTLIIDDEEHRKNPENRKKKSDLQYLITQQYFFKRKPIELPEIHSENAEKKLKNEENDKENSARSKKKYKNIVGSLIGLSDHDMLCKFQGYSKLNKLSNISPVDGLQAVFISSIDGSQTELFRPFIRSIHHGEPYPITETEKFIKERIFFIPDDLGLENWVFSLVKKSLYFEVGEGDIKSALKNLSINFPLETGDLSEASAKLFAKKVFFPSTSKIARRLYYLHFFRFLQYEENEKARSIYTRHIAAAWLKSFAEADQAVADKKDYEESLFYAFARVIHEKPDCTKTFLDSIFGIFLTWWAENRPGIKLTLVSQAHNKKQWHCAFQEGEKTHNFVMGKTLSASRRQLLKCLNKIALLQDRPELKIITDTLNGIPDILLRRIITDINLKQCAAEAKDKGELKFSEIFDWLAERINPIFSLQLVDLIKLIQHLEYSIEEHNAKKLKEAPQWKNTLSEGMKLFCKNWEKEITDTNIPLLVMACQLGQKVGIHIFGRDVFSKWNNEVVPLLSLSAKQIIKFCHFLSEWIKQPAPDCLTMEPLIADLLPELIAAAQDKQSLLMNLDLCQLVILIKDHINDYPLIISKFKNEIESVFPIIHNISKHHPQVAFDTFKAALFLHSNHNEALHKNRTFLLTLFPYVLQSNNPHIWIQYSEWIKILCFESSNMPDKLRADIHELSQHICNITEEQAKELGHPTLHYQQLGHALKKEILACSDSPENQQQIPIILPEVSIQEYPLTLPQDHTKTTQDIMDTYQDLATQRTIIPQSDHSESFSTNTLSIIELEHDDFRKKLMDPHQPESLAYLGVEMLGDIMKGTVKKKVDYFKVLQETLENQTFLSLFSSETLSNFIKDALVKIIDGCILYPIFIKILKSKTILQLRSEICDETFITTFRNLANDTKTYDESLSIFSALSMRGKANVLFEHSTFVFANFVYFISTLSPEQIRNIEGSSVEFKKTALELLKKLSPLLHHLSEDLFEASLKLNAAMGQQVILDAMTNNLHIEQNPFQWTQHYLENLQDIVMHVKSRDYKKKDVRLQQFTKTVLLPYITRFTWYPQLALETTKQKSEKQREEREVDLKIEYSKNQKGQVKIWNATFVKLMTKKIGPGNKLNKTIEHVQYLSLLLPFLGNMTTLSQNNYLHSELYQAKKSNYEKKLQTLLRF